MRDLPMGFNELINLVLYDSGYWVTLIEIQVDDSNSFLLCDAETSFEFQGDTYDPYPVKISNLLRAEQGAVRSLTLTVSNISQQIMAYIEADVGLIGREVYIILTSTTNPDKTGLSQKFKIAECSVNAREATFELNFFGLTETEFPNAYYSKNACMWEFGGTECDLDITDTNIYNPPTDSPCTKQLEGDYGCRFWGAREATYDPPQRHPKRFGAFPNLLNSDRLEV